MQFFVRAYGRCFRALEGKFHRNQRRNEVISIMGLRLRFPPVPQTAIETIGISRKKCFRRCGPLM